MSILSTPKLPVRPRRWGASADPAPRMSDRYLDPNVAPLGHSLDNSATINPKEGTSVSFYGGFVFIRQFRHGSTPSLKVLLSDDGYVTTKPVVWSGIPYQRQVDLIRHMSSLRMPTTEIAVTLQIPEVRAVKCLSNEQTTVPAVN